MNTKKQNSSSNNYCNWSIACYELQESQDLKKLENENQDFFCAGSLLIGTSLRRSSIMASKFICFAISPFFASSIISAIFLAFSRHLTRFSHPGLCSSVSDLIKMSMYSTSVRGLGFNAICSRRSKHCFAFVISLHILLKVLSTLFLILKIILCAVAFPAVSISVLLFKVSIVLCHNFCLIYISEIIVNMVR